MQELRRVGKHINAVAIADVPSGLNAAAAIDWHNGQGLFAGRGRIDDPNIAYTGIGSRLPTPSTGLTKWCRPPWHLADDGLHLQPRQAVVRGGGPNSRTHTEALQVAYPRIPRPSGRQCTATATASTPSSSSVPNHGLGDRTMQIAESKLSAFIRGAG